MGKTVIASELARQTGAVDLRVDSIEQAMCNSAALHQSLRMPATELPTPLPKAISGLATLSLGTVSTLSPSPATPGSKWRARWSRAAEIEIQCPDANEHR